MQSTDFQFPDDPAGTLQGTYLYYSLAPHKSGWGFVMNIDKAHLRDKRAAFRIDGIPGAFVETVALVENDGIWFHGPTFLRK